MIHVIKSELLKFGEGSSVKGVAKIFKSKDVIPRLLWLFFFLSSSVFMIYLLHKLFIEFYTYPIITKYGEQIGHNVTFPDVTLCNLDPLAEGEPKVSSLKEYLSFIKYEKKKFLEKILKSNSSNTEARMKEVKDALEGFDSFSGYIINMNKDLHKSRDCPDFVVDCAFFSDEWFKTKETCSISNFTRRWSANYYVCYTLEIKNLKFVNSTVIRGLNVILNVGPPNLIKLPYVSSLTNVQGRGIQVSVQSPGTPPDIKRGINFAVGTQNYLEIIQTERLRTDKPHNSEHYNDHYNEHYSDHYNDHYYNEHYNKHYNKHCHNENYNKHYDEHYKEHRMVNHCQSQCPMPCEETMYEIKYLSSTWPQLSVQFDLFENYFIDRGCMDVPEVRSRYINYLNNYELFLNDSTYNVSFSNLTKMQKSLIEMKFYIPQKFPYFQTDSPAYTGDMMIGTVGGMLSLWLGITVANGVEIVELVYVIFKRCWNIKMVSTKKNDENVNSKDSRADPEGKSGTDLSE
ncbi:hypothetical protein HELRODRAFT_165520 [Helobdella robusta]|uniref:Uncharacterized protein n=1 Tax=Helobdella robusta TaxID=6412 RepID=T1EWY7_HELRO|nr:hypothetical protein HELRODRAFT_165520 [Helobdella robusta]ESN91481.1 hypothetical protein HELRODRAFT_165520 [Helobdella robusta]